MTKLTTEELKELLGKVTQGEWRRVDYVSEYWMRQGYEMEFSAVHAGASQLVDNVTPDDATLIGLALTLTAEVERLREALEFYAEHHQDPNAGPRGMNSNDYGDIARQALSQE